MFKRVDDQSDNSPLQGFVYQNSDGYDEGVVLPEEETEFVDIQMLETGGLTTGSVSM